MKTFLRAFIVAAVVISGFALAQWQRPGGSGGLTSIPSYLNPNGVDAGYGMFSQSLQSNFHQAGAVDAGTSRATNIGATDIKATTATFSTELVDSIDAGSGRFSSSLQSVFSQVGAIDAGTTVLGAASATSFTAPAGAGLGLNGSPGSTQGVIGSGTSSVVRGSTIFLQALSGGSTYMTCTSTGCVAAVAVGLTARTLSTCAAAKEGAIELDSTGGGTTTSKRTKPCVCTSDGAGSATYRWHNLLNPTATTGNTTTCPDT